MFGCNFTALRRHKTSSSHSPNRYLVFNCISSSNFSEYVPFVSHSRSVYHLTQLCVPHLIKTKGSIVNVSSVNGQRSVGIKLLATYFPLHVAENWNTLFSLSSSLVCWPTACPSPPLISLHVAQHLVSHFSPRTLCSAL